MKYHFRIHNDPDGLWAECNELEGCRTQSEKGTMEDLNKNMEEALNLYLDEPDPNRLFPLPAEMPAGGDMAEVPVEPRIAFALLLKHERKALHLSQSEAARRMGFKSVWAYQKLETPLQSNPRLTTMAKVKKVFAGFDVSRVFA